MVEQLRKRKLSDDQAMHILNMRHSLGKTFREISKEYPQVSYGVLSNLCDGYTYRNVYMKYMEGRQGFNG